MNWFMILELLCVGASLTCMMFGQPRGYYFLGLAILVELHRHTSLR